jgi:hypothetical protein
MPEPLSMPSLGELSPFLTPEGVVLVDLALARWSVAQREAQIDALTGRAVAGVDAVVLEQVEPPTAGDRDVVD